MSTNQQPASITTKRKAGPVNYFMTAAASNLLGRAKSSPKIIGTPIKRAEKEKFYATKYSEGATTLEVIQI